MLSQGRPNDEAVILCEIFIQPPPYSGNMNIYLNYGSFWTTPEQCMNEMAELLRLNGYEVKKKK